MFEMTGFASIPGIDDIRQNIEAVITWGPWEYNKSFIVPAIIDSASTDAGNTPTTLLRPGLLLAQKRTAGNFKVAPWVPADAGTAVTPDGTSYLMGVLLHDLVTLQTGVAKDRWFGYVLVGGLIKASSLIIPGNAAAGIDGDANEYNVRTLMSGRFIFDDFYHEHTVSGINGGYRAIINRTVDLTLVEADNGTLYTTLGGAGARVFTLPAVTNNKGMRFAFYNAVDQNMTVASAAANQLITFNNAAASSVAFSTAANKIGGMIEVLGIGSSKWIVRPTGANILTVA